MSVIPPEFVDEEEVPDPESRRLTNLIIGAAIAVHRELGAGHGESIYANALALEFDARGIRFRREHRFEIVYPGKIVGFGKLDFLVEDAVIVETKSVEMLASLHAAQVISYLQATRLKLALLINFNVKLLTEGIRHISIFDH
jgi:GxxExxY protein